MIQTNVVYFTDIQNTILGIYDNWDSDKHVKKFFGNVYKHLRNGTKK